MSPSPPTLSAWAATEVTTTREFCRVRTRGRKTDSCATSHDAQAVIYKGPDARYTGKEIMFAYNEDSLTILGTLPSFLDRTRSKALTETRFADVTSKSNVVQLSRTGYNGSAYTHQGWLTDDNQSHLLLVRPPSHSLPQEPPR